MKVLVVDATHGGVTLSKEFAARGDEATLVDVHRTLTKEDLNSLSKFFNIQRDLPNPADYDLIVKPVHFPIRPFSGFEDRVISHHHAVKLLVGDMVTFPVAEITGSFGKTTAIMCAISLLKDRFSVLSLTSNGICLHTPDGTITLLEGVSATPANIIRAIRMCQSKPDFAIFEVSLGGTGLADLGIIKNVYDDYPIAKGSSTALKAKLSMVTDSKPGSTVLVNADDQKTKDLSQCQRFSPSGKCVEVRAEGIKITRFGVEFEAHFEGFKTKEGLFSGIIRVKTPAGPVGRQHVENLLVGVTIASFFRPSEGEYSPGTEIFNKKMVLESTNPPVVLNKSASIGLKSIEASMRDYLELFAPFRLEIGGKLKTTCGSVDPKEVASAIISSPFQEVFLYGDFGNFLAPMLKGKKVVSCSRRTGPSLV
ncbi:MAG: Mur ligase family protein, partial [Candidatus Verstraetearchaeota archaeon]|nr:Mur ligase family protein [Candidatus Verstraetearchaeota archaeon]